MQPMLSKRCLWIVQPRAMARLRDAIGEYPGRSQEEKDRLWRRIRLVLIGGCRNAEDERRVADLKVRCISKK